MSAVCYGKWTMHKKPYLKQFTVPRGLRLHHERWYKIQKRWDLTKSELKKGKGFDDNLKPRASKAVQLVKIDQNIAWKGAQNWF